jgi:demethylmenaquinone methyltransferase / 2-methoxy-6-polyprenyl-1,4-benzoquinol methylase
MPEVNAEIGNVEHLGKSTGPLYSPWLSTPIWYVFGVTRPKPLSNPERRRSLIGVTSTVDSVTAPVSNAAGPTSLPGQSASPESFADSAMTGKAAIDLTSGLPTGQAKEKAVRAMFDAISPRYDLVNRVMTFRMDVGWRRKTVRALALPGGSRVLDLAAGTGDFCRDLQKAGITAVGMDLSYGMLSHAKTTAPLVQADALRLPVPTGSVDGVTCGFALRNFVDLGEFFDELGRVVRPGGRIALLDASTPPNPLLKFGHGIYFGKVVPLIGALLSDPTAYRYLPKSLAYLPEPAVMLERLRAAGFSGVQRHLLKGGIAQLITGTRIGMPK